MSLRVLYVAYPLLPVSDESCGGAEQVLSSLEREMASRGHRTVVAAAAGSRVAGEVYATGAAPSHSGQYAERESEHHRQILQLLEHDPHFDLVHDFSGSFWKQAAHAAGPVLATCHLAPSFYSSEMFREFAPNLFFNCVSHSQAPGFAHLPRMLGVIDNGVDLARFVNSDYVGTSFAERTYLLWLGRICEEKGAHIALDVAAALGVSVVVAGRVYPFSYHQRYFDREIAPRLDRNPQAHFIESPSLARKVKLLTYARAVLVPSLIDETSSLVAMEAMACGTPVIAFRRGALPGVVADGVTGFIVDSSEKMVGAVGRLQEINPLVCRARAARHYSAVRMADDYEELYCRIISFDQGRNQSAAA